MILHATHSAGKLLNHTKLNTNSSTYPLDILAGPNNLAGPKLFEQVIGLYVPSQRVRRTTDII